MRSRSMAATATPRNARSSGDCATRSARASIPERRRSRGTPSPEAWDFDSAAGAAAMKFLLNHLLEESARHFPDKPAVLFDASVLTYAELDRISTRLAHVLIENGLRRGDRVGIWMSKSIASIVSIHGILKAGGVYVPLDPGAPPERVRYIVDDCGIRLLVSTPAFLERVREIVSGG